MAAKALFLFAAVFAVSLGLLLPTPGAHRAVARQSSIETLQLGR